MRSPVSNQAEVFGFVCFVGADPLAVTNNGMRPAALAAQGRCFELRTLLEKEAQKCAAYRGIELEELDRSQQVSNTETTTK